MDGCPLSQGSSKGSDTAPSPAISCQVPVRELSHKHIREPPKAKSYSGVERRNRLYRTATTFFLAFAFRFDTSDHTHLSKLIGTYTYKPAAHS
jgi:hypothetical protein